ncbi:rRNA maturation RNase YbeY [Moraxella porci DSM 25326]|uniref:Endoribonuclease YbeY n=2 Tax=Moraxella porci TaxID=1288392 RepID=A0A1T0CW88_9GAMM|nr:rRNA maturation RNase YbeY [Moraxella porci DSM 25326]
MMHQVFINISESLSEQAAVMYQAINFEQILVTALITMDQKLNQGLEFRYFLDSEDDWHKPKTLSLYITDAIEARELNLQARAKDYATNVLSYPTQLPAFLIQELPEIDLGELVFCHEVVLKEAEEQNKTFDAHMTHLVVHGILHLLGFDHEISDQDADAMESYEIEILAKLGINNPYLA